VALAPGILARGPWTADQIHVSWTPEPWDPPASATADADAELAALRERDSPSHDGLAARLCTFEERDGALHLALQPVRWAIRLTDDHDAQSLSVLCAVRDADGRWLAGRRAAWLASWAGRWALGAGGAVEVDENPAISLTRELEEEWSVRPERFTVEALAKTPGGLVLLVGMAWLPRGAEVVADAEHDAHAWWPADVADWPDEADEPLRLMAQLLA
jgi:8-oxo-dGTP diphosphatase